MRRKKAFLINRIGDAAFLLAIFTICVRCGGFRFSEVFRRAQRCSSATATTVALLLFVGAVGKSAQLPLYVWLPDAMEGPTSVSALIHAATMVTAGVYMIARNSVIYNMAPQVMQTVAIIGAATAIFAASIALVQKDIKKVLAYSTISQLGFMFLGCGVGAYISAIFHLMTHAFFKGLLFLGSGSVIHALGGEQDMRYMGGLRKHMPITATTFIIATIAIAGIPPFAGFWSKDEILAETFKSGHVILWGVGVVAALMTSFYMFRLIFLTFFGKSRVSEKAKHHLHESPATITIPLGILAILSIVGGIIPGFPPERGWIHGFLGPVIASAHHVTSQVATHHDTHGLFGLATLDLKLMSISIGVAILGFILALYFYLLKPGLPERIANHIGGLHRLLENKYWVDEIYQKIFVRPLLKIADTFWAMDAKVVDGIVNGVARVTVGGANKSNATDQRYVDGLVNGIGKLASYANAMIRKLQTGMVQHYALTMIVGLLVLMTGLFYGPFSMSW